MSETTTASRTAARFAVGAAVLFAAAMFLTVASVNVPHGPSESELLEWWQQKGNRTSGVLSGVFALSAAALLAILMSHVLQLDATRRSPTWRAFARTMTSGFAAAMLVTAATRSSIGQLVDVMGEPLPGTDTLRYATALNYQVLGLAAMGALSLTILATSVLALRTTTFARWAAWVGLACGSVMLVAAAVGYGGYTVPLAILWSLTLGIAIRH